MDLLSAEEVLIIAGEEKVQIEDYKLENKSPERLGYMGRHLTLTLNLSSERGKTQRRFFVKAYEERVEGVNFLIFKREQEFYKIVIEGLRKCVGKLDWCPQHRFSNERVLGSAEMKDDVRQPQGTLPRGSEKPEAAVLHFLSLTENMSKNRVLEDLSEKGFEMVGGERGPLDLNMVHLKTTLQTLASMHATSLLLEHRESKSLPALFPTVLGREILYDENKPESPSRKWIASQIQDLLEGVDYLNEYSHDEKTYIKENFEKQIMRIFPLSKVSEKFKNVLTHGDMWKNNLLFRYSDENLPKECRFVDFQFIRYAPPAHDVMHLLHYAMKKEARTQSESHLLHFYFEQLKNKAQEHGMEIEEMSEEKFLESCEIYKELALIQCLLSLHYILGPATLTDEAKSYKKYQDFLTNHRKIYMSKFFQNESYVDKIKDTFCELIDTYIIQK